MPSDEGGFSDWGSDTLARYRFQAEVTLPFCLAIATGQEDIVKVIPEHLEDIALRTSTGWRFIQVKSRNPERGLWTLSSLLAKRGALRSLYRTYRCTVGEDHPLELALEGALKTRDRIQGLKLGRDKSQLVPYVAERLKARHDVVQDFLARVVLNESVPARSAIAATNQRLIHQLAPLLNNSELVALHAALLAEIEAAMRSGQLGALWPRSVTHPERRSPTFVEKIRAKTLDAHRLAAIVEPLSRQGRPLLRRFVASGSGPITQLAQKMLLGGATQTLVDRARNLQANARHHRFERLSQDTGETDSALYDDLHERLLTHATTAVAVHDHDPRPAVGTWSSLLKTFHASGVSIDRNNLVRADPMLLMGEACSLSDGCLFGWGETQDEDA